MFNAKASYDDRGVSFLVGRSAVTIQGDLGDNILTGICVVDNKYVINLNMPVDASVDSLLNKEIEAKLASVKGGRVIKVQCKSCGSKQTVVLTQRPVLCEYCESELELDRDKIKEEK